jgi:hypothetical protein
LLARETSGFNPKAVSPAGAQGIAQFMPGTAARYGVNVWDPASSIEGAAHYLSDLSSRYGGNMGLMAAGYNWGEGNVDKWLAGKGKPPSETTNYVSAITGHSIDEWKADPRLPLGSTGPGRTPTGASPTAPAVAGAPTTDMGPAPGAAAPPEFAKTPVGKSLDELAKAMTPDQQQQQPQFLNLPSRPRNVSPYLGGQGMLGSGQSPAGAQIQQELGYQPTPVYGTGLTSLPPSWSGATPGSPTQNQPQFGGFGPQTSPYGTSIGTLHPMVAQMLVQQYGQQRQESMFQPQGAATGGFGYG